MMLPLGVDSDLWAEAVRLRGEYWGKSVYLRGIVEFSNHCAQNCLYCGLRRDNGALVRYRLDSDVIFAAAQAVRDLDLGTVVLQSGEDGAFTADSLAELISRIKQELGLAVTLSLGERRREDYALWRAAGADRYLLKLETLDETQYTRLRPGKQLGERLRALQDLAELGYETGSGLIAGLPGETGDGLERGLIFLAELGLDMVSISPFTPAPGTPFAQEPACGLPEIFNAMARTRVLMPRAHIPVTSALGLHGDAVRLKVLEVGDVLMPSLTPAAVRSDYAIYAGKNSEEQDPGERAAAMRRMLLDAGFTLPVGPGSAWRLIKEN
jgi:biotin synthase